MLYQLSHVRVLAERPGPFGAWNTIYGSFGALQNGRAPRWGRPAISHTGGASAIVFLRGRLAQLVARFVHTEEVISSSLVSPTATKTRPGSTRGGFSRSRDHPPCNSGQTHHPLPRLEISACGRSVRCMGHSNWHSLNFSVRMTTSKAARTPSHQLATTEERR